jgi:putative transposase
VARKRSKGGKEPGTIWRIPDKLWKRIEPLINDTYPVKVMGRPRADLRKVLDAVVFRLRSGCQWNRLPEDLSDDSTAHRWFQRWCRDGFFEKLWAVLLAECQELGGVDWQWQAADCSFSKARLGGRKLAPIRQIERKQGRRRASSWKRAEGRSQ